MARWRSIRYFACLLVGALVAAHALGQETSTQDGGAGLIIRSTTALVQVRVVAEDGLGRKITNLQKEEFEVRDDGKPQPIAIFVADRGGRTKSKDEAAIPVADSGPGYAAILLDWLNDRYGERLKSQDSVLKLLTTFQPGQKVALYVLPHDPPLVASFTADMKILAQVVSEVPLDPDHLDSKYSVRYPPKLPCPVDPSLPPGEQERRTMKALETTTKIADSLARMPGRKSLIWLSGGFDLERRDGIYRQPFEKLVTRLNRGDVGAYTIDACGLALPRSAYQPSLIELAQRTGGTAFVERNDLDEGVRQALEDQRVGYTLAYRLPDDAKPGAHEIALRTRRSGVRLRYRESYQLVEPVK